MLFVNFDWIQILKSYKRHFERKLGNLNTKRILDAFKIIIVLRYDNGIGILYKRISLFLEYIYQNTSWDKSRFTIMST